MAEIIDTFSPGIQHVIDEMSEPLYVIHSNKNVRCTCVNFCTKDPDPNCNKCLGRGYQIIIKRRKGALQFGRIDNAVLRGSQQIFVDSLVYFNGNVDVEADDIIVDLHDNVLFVYQSSPAKAFKGEQVYTKCLCIKKNHDSKSLLNGFHNIIGDRHD